MTRLDSALVKQKLISSRSRAQRAVRLGFVTVNGRLITKPALQVTPADVIVVDAAADKPGGYWKLRQIQEACTLIKPDDVVLDIGASAGGFMLYALERAKSVYALEFSSSMKHNLDQIASQYPGQVTVLQADAFTLDFDHCADYFDVILNDITADPEASLRVLARSTIALKTGGQVLQVLKGKMSAEAVDYYKRIIEEIGYSISFSLTSHKEELFIVAEKMQA